MKQITLIIVLFFPGLWAIANDLSNVGNLYEPPPVAFRFETSGWYVLMGTLMLLCLILVFFWSRSRMLNKYRRVAIREIVQIENDKEAVFHTFIILKKVAIHVFGRDTVATLNGDEWLQFLEKTGKQVELSAFTKNIYTSIYEGQKLSSDKTQHIILNAKKWILTHAR